MTWPECLLCIACIVAAFLIDGRVQGAKARQLAEARRDVIRLSTVLCAALDELAKVHPDRIAFRVVAYGLQNHIESKEPPESFPELAGQARNRTSTQGVPS